MSLYVYLCTHTVYEFWCVCMYVHMYKCMSLSHKYGNKINKYIIILSHTYTYRIGCPGKVLPSRGRVS